MTSPTLTPAEQIARFIERHPGEWWPSASPHAGRLGGAETSKRLLLRWTILWVYPYRDGVEFAVTFGGGPAQVVPRDLLLGRLAEHEARHIIERGGDVEYLPAWLHDGVRRILRTRAGELLTLAGSSPADVVSAAETVDEALCARPVVEPTLSAMLAALQGIGMSCRWIRNPGDTGINPEREALQDARAGLACADDEMTREQYVDLFRDLRRVLGVT